MPENGMSANVPKPRIVALNLTRRCNLRCAHCYLDAGTLRAGGTNEMPTAEIAALLGDIAAMSDGAMVVLTGGEPLLRPDLEEIAREGTGRGLMMVVGTNGTLLTPQKAAALRDAGVTGLGISLDSLEPSRHDAFRGRPGCWARTMAGIDACKEAGLAFQIHFSVTEDNAHEFEAMIAFARSAGALVLNVFFMVCTGRGERYTGIPREVYESVLAQVTRAAHEETGLIVRAKCAPHFKRLAMEYDPSWPVTLAHGYEAGGCVAGTSYFRVTPEGEVTPCPYIEQSVGSLRARPLAELWANAPLFRLLRAPSLEGRCGACEFRKLCGGCRARPMAEECNPMGEDSLCGYVPRGEAVIEAMPETQSELAWTPEGAKRLARVPPFVRRMIRRRAEEFVRAQGRMTVDAADLHALASRRFGSAGGPAHPACVPAKAVDDD